MCTCHKLGLSGRSAVFGCCAEARGSNLGAQMVESCLQEARELGVCDVFVLTNIEKFFAKLGFMETDKHVLPQKIWADCINCPQFPDCDEIPMIMKLN